MSLTKYNQNTINDQMFESSFVLLGDTSRKYNQLYPMYYTKNIAINIERFATQNFIDILAIKSCNCGSTSHSRISHNSFPINKRLTKPSTATKNNLPFCKALMSFLQSFYVNRRKANLKHQ